MTRKLRWIAVAAAATLLSPLASAWWVEGHMRMVHDAASALPDDTPAFFREGEARIAFYSMEPDLWTNADLPALRSSERFNHFFDIELLGGRPVPPSRLEFLLLCRESRLEPSVVGTLPYAVQEWYERLVLAFGEHRKFPPDEAIQNKVLYIAGVLSHYAGDVAQPLHCTVHYDGRASPDGTSPGTGIHLKLDALPGRPEVAAAGAVRRLQVEPIQDALAATVAAIRESNRRVERVYQLEDRLPPVEGPLEVPLDPQVRDLAVECMEAGAVLTASLWHSAWLRSAQLTPPQWLRSLPTRRTASLTAEQ